MEIPEEIKNNIENVIEKMKLALTPVKWVLKKNLHITLKFLGWIDDNKIGELTAATTSCVKDLGSIDVSFSGLGVFPDQKHPRVIWVGIKEGGEKVTSLANCIDTKLAKLGYKTEERGFSPHLAIGRIKERIDVEVLNSLINERADIDLGSFNASYVSIMKSTLRRTGPIYEEMEQVSL